MITGALLAAFLALSPVAIEARCTGCSCRGGPGFRAEDGKCVGWKDLKRKCGEPPEARCTDERDGKRRDGRSSSDQD
jgi:hypothetical protein